MKCRHYLTLRHEGPRGAVGYSSINTEGATDTYEPHLPNTTLLEMIEGVRTIWAERLECRPDRITIVIVNHMAVVL